MFGDLQLVVPEVGSVEAARLLAAGALLLDVREPDEYAAAHVRGARLIPLGQLAGSLSALPRTGTVLAICRSGRRSTEAVGLLQRAGFEDARNLAGGMLAWHAACLPVQE